MRFCKKIDYRLYICVLVAGLVMSFMTGGCSEEDKRLEDERRARIRTERTIWCLCIAASFLMGTALGSSHRKGGMPNGSVE